jgi:glycosyltransferase involved in cell wall biosynthesis
VHILFLNRSYWPDVEATGQLLTELCEDLAPHARVTVVAGQPNHRPNGEPFRRRGLDQRNGVTIDRVWHTRLPKSLLLTRAINLVTYLLSATLAAWRRHRPDVVVVETDPPLLCLLGAWLRRRHGCRLVVYLQDIHPHAAIALGKLRSGPLTNWLRRRFFAVYRSADRVIVLSEDMRAVLIQGGVDERRIVTIPNWSDTRRILPVPHEQNDFRRQHVPDGALAVVYSGNLGLCQGLETVLDAATSLADRTDIRFLLIGGGVLKSKLQRLVSERGLTNVQFLDYQPKERLSHSLSAADVHLVPLDPRVAHYIMPSKLYGVLAAGRPVIAATRSDCDLARAVKGEEVGFVVPPGDAETLADRIAWCAENRKQLGTMSRLARRLAEDHYDRRLQTGRFHELLAGLLEPAPTSPGPPITSTDANRATSTSVV